ncbi:uncharacterized protein [Medicago truncatula]|nr:uncharacterized protein LOC25480596 [Medicago truncatula]
MSMNFDCFWDLLEKFESATDVSCIKIIQDFFYPCIQLLTSLVQNPVNLENKNEMGELVSLLDEMKQLKASSSLFSIDTVTEKCTTSELSNKISSMPSKVAHILNQLNLSCKRNTNVQSDPSQANTAVGNDDHGQAVLKESKENMSNNSQAAVISGQGKAKENNKRNKYKSKNNKRGKKNK